MREWWRARYETEYDKALLSQLSRLLFMTSCRPQTSRKERLEERDGETKRQLAEARRRARAMGKVPVAVLLSLAWLDLRRAVEDDEKVSQLDVICN